MPDGISANLPLLVSRDQIGAKINHALRLFVGRGRRYSVKELSNATGVKDRVIECAMCCTDSPDYRPLSLEAFASISKFLGAQFSTVWLALADQGAFDLPDGGEPRPGDLAADNSDDNAIIVRAARDGVCDKEERPHLREVGIHLMDRGAQLVALGKAA